MSDDFEKREEESGELSAEETYYYLPTMHLGPSLPHYYGDYVRKLFVAAAALMLVLAPFFGGFLPLTLPFEIIGAVVLVAFGALTNPKKQWVVAGDVLLAGTLIIAYEGIALYAYLQNDVLVFFTREALVVIFVFAFYFSMKTLRAMMQHQIGKREPPGEFIKPTVEERWHSTHTWQ